jgi:hypothetical protein
MTSPITVADTDSVASPDHKYCCLPAELADQLVSIYRIMFPHDVVPDQFYEHVVRKLDDNAAQDQDLTALLSEGVKALSHQTKAAWTGLGSDTKGRPMIKAAIFIVALTTSIGSRKRSFNLCHEHSVLMTTPWW